MPRRTPAPAAAASPFRFEGPVEPDDLIGRAAETAQLLGYCRAGRAVSLAAPRRYGKTSLLRRVGATLAEDGTVVARVDLLGLEGPADFATRFATAWRRAVDRDRGLRAAVERGLAALAGLGVTVAGVGVSVSFDRDRDPGPVLQALLDLPRQAQGRVLVVLDEFQAVHAAWPNGEGVLRGHVQEQLGRAAYVFAGSQPHLLEAAFADRGRAFYQQVLRVPLGRLPDAELAPAIAERFAATDRDAGPGLWALVRLAAGHPQRAMFLAHLLWEATPAGGRAGEPEWARALELARRWTADEMTAVWLSLSAAQQAAARAVHRYGAATVADAVRPGLSRSSLQSAQDSLLRQGVVEPDEGARGPRAGRRFRLVDPMLGDWIERRRAV